MGLLTAERPRDTAIAWAYVLAQVVLLAAVLLLPAGTWWTLAAPVATVTRALALVGAAVLVVGLVNLGRSLTPLPTPIEHGELRTGGLYRLVRHPIYTGLMALTVGSALRSGSPTIALATVALIVLLMAKSRWEEHHLRSRYPGYDDYAARTPRFVPLWPLGTDRR